MKPARQAARQRLKDSTRAEYDALIHAAKLTPTQKRISDMHFLHGLSICEIAFRLFCCESLIRRRLSEVYDKVAKS